MQVTPLFTTFIFLIGTIFSLHALPLEGVRLEERKNSRESCGERSPGIPQETESSGYRLPPRTPQYESYSTTGTQEKRFYFGDSQEEKVAPYQKTDPATSDFSEGEEKIRKDIYLEEPLSEQERKIFSIFIQHNTRLDTIEQKIASYEEELRLEKLNDHSTKAKQRLFLLPHLIATLQAASVYQSKRIAELTKQVLSAKFKKEGEKISNQSIKIHESPNKIELLADQIEFEHETLQHYQLIVEVLEQQESLPNLESAKANIKEAIEHQQALIKEIAVYAQILPAPHEQINQERQFAIDDQLLKYKNEKELVINNTTKVYKKIISHQTCAMAYFNACREAARSKAAEEAQQLKPCQYIIDHYTQATNFYQQCAAEYALGNKFKAVCLEIEANAHFQIARETQRLELRQNVIDAYTQVANLYQQAATEEELGNHNRASCFYDAAPTYFKIALEAQHLEPRQNVIDSYIQSINLYQEAATEYALGHEKKAMYLKTQAYAHNKIAEEIERLEPRQNIIDWYTQSLGYDQEAISQYTLGHEKKALCIHNVSFILLAIAQEMQRVEPRQNVIDWYNESINALKQAIIAYDLGNKKNSIYLNNTGIAFYRAAKEAQKSQPNQQIIDNLLNQAAELQAKVNLETSFCVIS